MGCGGGAHTSGQTANKLSSIMGTWMSRAGGDGGESRATRRDAPSSQGTPSKRYSAGAVSPTPRPEAWSPEPSSRKGFGGNENDALSNVLTFTNADAVATPALPKMKSSDLLKRRKSWKWFEKRGVAKSHLKRIAELYFAGQPDVKGQLNHDGFCIIFHLNRDTYTDRLVKIFDLDDSGMIGLREFIYGLGKFADKSFEARVAFAYRLFDLDGDGKLDKAELLFALTTALKTDLEPYRTMKMHTKFHPRRAPRGLPHDPDFACPGGEEGLIKEVNSIATRLGSDKMGYVEFQMLCARFPRIFAPCKKLYERLEQYSQSAGKIVEMLGADGITELQESLGRFASSGFTGGSKGFDDRPAKRTYSKIAAGKPDAGTIAAMTDEKKRKDLRRGGSRTSLVDDNDAEDSPNNEEDSWKSRLEARLKAVDTKKDFLGGGGTDLSRGSGARAADGDNSYNYAPKCRVCMYMEVEILIRPCGHFVMCTSCANKVDSCPLCRTPVNDRIRAYLS